MWVRRCQIAAAYANKAFSGLANAGLLWSGFDEYSSNSACLESRELFVS
jgi:hypothetical protein